MSNDVEDGPELDELNFAANLLHERESRSWSRAEFVRKLREAGWATVHQTTVTRIEKAERSVRIGEARIIASVLNRSVEQMTQLPAQFNAEIELRYRRLSLAVAQDKMRQAAAQWLDAAALVRESIDRARPELPDLTQIRASLNKSEQMLRRTPEQIVSNAREQFESERGSDESDA